MILLNLEIKKNIRIKANPIETGFIRVLKSKTAIAIVMKYYLVVS